MAAPLRGLSVPNHKVSDMKARTLVLIGGIAIGLAAGSAISGVNEESQKLFQSANVTNPGYVDSLSRGVITGGNVSLRSPIVQVTGLSVTPPDISAGCGGIDLYGGNLSFPSKEQFISIGRAVAQNVGGYAFKLALKQICESCETTMTKIQDTITDLNMGNLDSCQIAQKITSPDTYAAIKSRGRSTAAEKAVNDGDDTDLLAASKQGDKAGPSGSLASNPAFAGNRTWQAMERTSAFDWLGGGRETKEEIMSLIGTVIVCVPGSNGCPPSSDGGNDPRPYILKPVLRLQDFVALDREQSVGPVYRCNNDQCVGVTIDKNARLGTSVSQKIVDSLLGTPEKPGVILRSISRGESATPATEAEKTMIALAGDDYPKALMCARAGGSGVGHARTIIEGTAPRIAARALHQLSEQSLQHLVQNLGEASSFTLGGPEALAMVEESRKELRLQFAAIDNAFSVNDRMRDAIQRCGANPIGAALMGAGS